MKYLFILEIFALLQTALPISIIIFYYPRHNEVFDSRACIHGTSYLFRMIVTETENPLRINEHACAPHVHRKLFPAS